jgi:hypothetical protein
MRQLRPVYCVLALTSAVALTGCGSQSELRATTTAPPSSVASASQTADLSWDAQYRLIEIGDALKQDLGTSFGGEEIDRPSARLLVHFAGTHAAFQIARAKVTSKYGSAVLLVQAVQPEAAAVKLRNAIATALQGSTVSVSQLAVMPDGTVRVWTSESPASVLAQLANDGIRVRSGDGQALVDVVNQDIGSATPVAD